MVESMVNDMPVILILFLEFLHIGVFAIGGGMAAIPFLIRMSNNHPEWFSLSMLTDMIAVSEATPGPIGINMATYIGYIVADVPGAVLTSVAVVLPAFLLLLFLTPTLEKHSENTTVIAVFKGLRPAVTGLIAAAGAILLGLILITDSGVDFASFILFAIILTCTQLPKLKKLHPTIFIGVAAFIGIIFGL